MRKTKKRFLSALLACTMIVSLFPFAAFAATTKTVGTFEDLKSAVESAHSGDTIELTANITIPGGAANNLVIDKAITIDGKNYTITRAFTPASDYEAVFSIQTAGVTIKNVAMNGLTHGGMDDSAVYINANGGQDQPINIENCTFNGDATSPDASGVTGILSTYKVADYVNVDSCSFTNLKYAMYFNDISNAVISNNNVEGTKYTGIYLEPEANVTVEKNTLTNIATANYVDPAYSSGIYVGNTDGSDTDKTTAGLIIKDNNVTLSAGNTNGVAQGSVNAAEINGTQYATLDAAITAASSGNNKTITLLKDLESSSVINLPEGVTLDGNGHTLTYTGGSENAPTNGAFITTSGKDVTIKNITINAKNIKHGVQFYCCDGGTLENAVVNGGTYTSVIVNGATNVSIVDSDLNPAASAYTNIEYAMGQNVTTVPSMSIDNVSFDGTKLYVWADADTTGRVETAMGGEKSNDEILAEILDNITYTNDNGGRLEISVGFVEGVTSGSVESTYQPPYTGKYSYAINVADTDNGSVSVDKYATEGEKVTLTVSPDKAYKLDELTVTTNGKDVDLTDNGDGTYTFTMPSSNVKVSASFVEDKDYVEPDNSITVSMTIGSNDFVINNNIVTVPDAAPYIANDRTYVPFRALGEALGAKVVWDNDARTVTYTLGDTEIVMTIGDTTYTINGVEKSMDVAPEITGDRTYVPVRFVAEGLGFKVTPLYADNGTTASVVFEK